MRNRGMDGVGMAKTLCFPDHPDDYAYRIMVKGPLQIDVEKNLAKQWQAAGKNFTQDELRREARNQALAQQIDLIGKIKTVFLDPYFDYTGETDPSDCRERYKSNEAGEWDNRNFGDANSDPGDIFFANIIRIAILFSIKSLFSCKGFGH